MPRLSRRPRRRSRPPWRMSRSARLRPSPRCFIDPAASEPEALEREAVEPASFIPPQPERPPTRAPRMPRIDELPVPAQNEIRARRGELVQDEHPQKRHMSLLQRLASVGLGRREHDEQEPAPAQRPAPVSAPPPTERLAGRPMPRPAEPRQEPRQESRQERRFPNMPSVRPRRGWTSMAGSALCITRAKRINSTYRHSCAGKRIERGVNPLASVIRKRPRHRARLLRAAENRLND